MFDYTIFKDKTLIITPNVLKNKILRELMSYNKLLNIKVLSLNELERKVFFEIKDEAFYKVYKTFNKPFSILKNIFEYLYYIDVNKDYQNEKINELVYIKKYLIDNNLLTYHEYFLKNINQFKVYFLGFTHLDNKLKNIIAILKEKTEVYFTEYYLNTFKPKVIHLKTIEDELDYVAYNISCLINNNHVDIKNIKIANLNNDYLFHMERIFKNYNLKVNIKKNISLFKLPLSSLFLEFLNTHTKNETIEYLNENYKDYSEYINLYIDILNKYYYITEIENQIIKYELQNTFLKPITYDNAIDIINIDEIGNSDDYIFVLSCNYNYFPKILKDEDYLLDFEKEIINISTTKMINENNLIKLKKLITSSKNIFLTYKDTSYFNDYIKSSILNDYSEIEYEKNILISYSDNENILYLAKRLDEKNNDLNTKILYSNYDIDYLKYNNEYKKIDLKTFNNIILNNPLTISYSSLNCFYECKFKYYLKYILKIDLYTKSINSIIGNIMHEVVEKCFDDDFVFDIEFEKIKEKNLINIDLKPSELFFINNIKNRTKDVVDFLLENESKTKLNNHIHEKKVVFNKTINDKNILIKGFIDKIIYHKENGNIYLAIIDLKTGNDKILPELFEYGLSLQLPFYIYLLKHDNENIFNNAQILGIYIQNILNKENTNQKLMYHGYTLDNISLLNYLDNNYESSSLISKLKINKDGSFSKNSDLISDKEINNLNSLVEEKIDNMINEIYNLDFSINPKIYNDNNLSCKYCNYSSICYKSYKDYIYLNKKRG